MKNTSINSGCKGSEPTARKGFTLVELMVVVAIIGLLAAIAVPAYAKVRMSSQSACFIADVRTAKTAFMQYCIERGNYPADVTPGLVPAGMSEYLGRFAWTESTPIGGQWDWDYRQFGNLTGVSVFQPTAPVEQLQQIDKTIDDGNLGTGSFQTRSSGYISIIE